jgi:bifunctional DNase/RNase
VRLQNEIFYGNIIAEVDGREVEVDSRPSDAIALSVRAHVPILVNSSVMDEAGIIPEQDMPEGEENLPLERNEPAPMSEESTERLSVFEDFLEKLDFDKPESDADDDDDESDSPKKPKKK